MNNPTALSCLQHGKWNDFRVTVISDMVWARLNDGENIEARLEENPDQSGPIITTTNDTSYVGSVIASFSNYITDYAESFLKPDARAVFTEFNGAISLGAVRAEYPGFRGVTLYYVYFALKYGFLLKVIARFSSKFRKLYMGVCFGSSMLFYIIYFAFKYRYSCKGL